MTESDQAADEAAGTDEFALVRKWWRRLTSLGCFLRVGGAIAVIVVVMVLLIEFVDIGSGGPEEESFIAGPAEGFANADVNAFDVEHVFLVRYADGEFRAFYDKSSKQQELPGSDCRILYNETAGVGTLEQVPGMRGAFVEECDGARSVWRVDGTYSFGTNYGNLDEFRTRIDDAGNLIVITETRTCTRSAGVPGLEPFEVTECSGAP